MTPAETPARAPRAAVQAAAAALIGLAVYLFFGHSFLNYDSAYALLWGDEIANGRTPDYEAPVAPTPHPLLIGIGVVLSPLGDAAEGIVLALVCLSIGAIGVGLYRLGVGLFVPVVGVLAAAIFLTRVPPLNFGIRGYVDLPTIALVVWAAVLELRRPRRGAPVLVLLLVAGLLRPEAWLSAGVYFLWLVVPLPAGLASRLGLEEVNRRFPARTELRDRLVPLALTAAAPLLWALSDLLVTGDPLWSLNGTSDLAADLGRPTGLDDVPTTMPRRLGEIMRAPELVAAVAGFGIGLWLLRRRTLLPAAIAILNGVAFLVFAVAGLPLLGRYLFLAAAMLSLLAALGALGWRALAPGDPARGRWRALGAALLVAFAVFFPVQAGRLGDLRDDIADRDRVQDDLKALVETPQAERAFERCDRLFVPNHRPVPHVALWTDLRPGQIVSAQLERPGRGGALLEPASEEVAALSILDPKDPARFDATRPEGYVMVASNDSWVLTADCPRT